jgi:hypothetical protein
VPESLTTVIAVSMLLSHEATIASGMSDIPGGVGRETEIRNDIDQQFPVLIFLNHIPIQCYTCFVGYLRTLSVSRLYRVDDVINDGR